MACMADVRSLHDNAVVVRPKNIETKPSNFLVAVLHLDKLPSGTNGDEDFLWIKCHGRLTAQKLRDAYEKKFMPAERWVLKHGSKVIANLQISMSELDTYHDHLIVFEAIKASDTSRLVTRQPLQPTSNQASGAPSQNRNMDGARDIKSASRHGSEMPIKAETQDENQALPGTPAMPERHSASGSELGASSSNANMSGFRQFYDSQFGIWKMSMPGDSEAAIRASILQDWYNRSPSYQANYAMNAAISPGSSILKHEVNPETGMHPGASPANRHFKSEPQNQHGAHIINPVDEPPISASELDEQKPKQFQLQSLLKDAGPQVLESSVEQGVKLLNRVKAPLLAKVENNPDAEQWIEQIDNLRKQAVKTKTIIGVVGNTGAGKSSVINAMLDEERLVPTNCMRACTAVVTEISYNYDDVPYRAQIEFISSAEWEKELKTLFQDLLDGNGQVSRDCANEDTDAGIAYAKIKAVYPRKTKEDIANSNIETMLREVSSVLGSSKDIKEIDSLVFYKKLQNFVDSKEKTTGNKEKGKKERKEMEFWPLIRVVRIHVKSPALATGAVIVDLPGVHDANAARAAVAEGYMKQCTGLWIVAPINRAVDDKAAKSLLGESFKRQLKMDGGFNSVTFICSKTDDISLGEAQDSLGLDEEMAPCWEEMDGLVAQQKSMKKRLEELKNTKAVYGDAMNDVDEQIEVWDNLNENLESGKTVYAPKLKATKKRKSNSKEKSRKRSRRSGSSGSDDYEDSDAQDKDSDEEAGDLSDEAKSPVADPLTGDEITAKLQELRNQRKQARHEKLEITEKITELRKEIEEAKAAEDKINSKLSALCITGRNQYSKGAIQQDFAAGIKELDQELAAEEDEENFNPDAETRDYDEVARSLPVFCVSSRGYQKLQGRLRKDPNIAGFTSTEQTEIPQLQAHCEKLTENGRSANCRTFINKLSQLLNSLTLWASSDGTGEHLTPEQRAREARYLQKGLETLESGLETAVKDTCTELSDEFSDNIFDKYETAISNATKDAVETAFKWGAPVNREDRPKGGLHWSTYKAICRRRGIYTNGQGPHEWNAQLAEPMMKILASGWEKTFARRLPMVMATFGRKAASQLKKFHSDIESRARKIGSSIAGLSMLQHQISTYESILKDLSNSAKDTINTKQKDINREFVPVIERAMIMAYEQCVNESGTGSFARMKAHMNSHVAHERYTMFQESADNVKDCLDTMVKDVGNFVGDKTDEVFNQMKRDYRSIIGGGDIPQEGQILPREQRLVRKEVMKAIEDVERVFTGVVRQEIEKDKEGDDETKLSPVDKVEDQDTTMDKINEESNPSLCEQASSPLSHETTHSAADDESTRSSAPQNYSETSVTSHATNTRLRELVHEKVGADSDATSGSDASGSD